MFTFEISSVEGEMGSMLTVCGPENKEDIIRNRPSVRALLRRNLVPLYVKGQQNSSLLNYVRPYINALLLPKE